MPYCSNVSENISANLKDVNIKTAYVPLNPIGIFFCSFENKYLIFDISRALHRFHRKDFKLIYIEEIRRSLNARIKKYKNYFNKGTLSLRLIAPALQFDPGPVFDNAQVMKFNYFVYISRVFSED